MEILTKAMILYLLKKYIIRLNIILDNISNTGVTIDGIDKITECELPTELHQEILQRAVELAKAAYIGDFNATVGVGNVSSTNIGIIPSNTSK